MSTRKIFLIFIVAVAAQFVVFRVAYRDLLWLNGPAAVLSAADVDTTRRTAAQTLERPHVTRRHLEALALATAREETWAEHVRTLERLRRDNPQDVRVALRVAEAYRRAGRHDEARALFASIVEETPQ